MSALPLVGVSLLLVDRPKLNAYVAFLGGWATGAIVVGVLAIAVSDLSTPNQQPPAVWVVSLRLILGFGLIAFAIRKLVNRDAPNGDGELPRWMSAFKEMRPLKTFALGAGLSALNPKNAALIISGALTIAAKTYAPASQFVAMIGFVAVSSMGLALPLVLSILMGTRAEHLLKRLSDFMAKYSTMIVALVLAVLGGIVFVNALADL